MALVELYRTVGDPRYLDLANVFIDVRGSQPGSSDLNQDRVPLREEQEVVGHMVLATYLHAGAADAYLEGGDRTLLDVLDRLWRDLTEHKMYVHGGSARSIAACRAATTPSGRPPGRLTSCPAARPATRPAPRWQFPVELADAGGRGRGPLRRRDGAEPVQQHPLRHRPGRRELVLHQCAALGRCGHPLLTQDAYERFQPGRKHVCCPANLLRLIAGLHGYAYGVSDAGLWVHLYGANRFDGALPNGAWVRLTQETDYPWDGAVRITLDVVSGPSCAIELRIPGWAAGATLAVNGERADVAAEPGSYATLDRAWSAGDVIELTLPLRVRLLAGRPRIAEVRNQVAVMRGPLVYRLESPDLPAGVQVSEMALPRDIALAPRHQPELLGGVTVLDGEAPIRREGDWSRRLYREVAPAAPERARIRLIPYYAWSNRGVSEMPVWLPLSR